jgi:hypothetical protein
VAGVSVELATVLAVFSRSLFPVAVRGLLLLLLPVLCCVSSAGGQSKNWRHFVPSVFPLNCHELQQRMRREKESVMVSAQR